MHEIGVMIEVVKTVEKFAKQNGVTQIQTLVLQIGELSTVVPRYIKACYPAAIEGTLLENTQLQIEILPGNAICDSCNKVFNILESKSVCPYCNSKNWEMLTGKEFNIKEIVAC
ncbi:hydrogenase maturation nickel metallochaperone HypA [Candidatus Galacturonibacter soehngenii]|uniref:Hydrogenase maturation factor HypA n=1 Tax=Candidatus Galacturonatibacter soehngenii TaxID=2307010 RepID=A0A7V7QJK1_9FIRM|nr:hydrogenase maturation nickel metallochaperone HypA [Candidatus Galacturonibacter soehngenii]KAB1437431.1 hydrogenase maturation nickel metallochaperone HypA [Candidatus Galacturonibacter soehngenii]MBA4688638.1 hydrogenase maturation nickel metallochaperone HypA [Candidatus Galacturonibacter soehngenii]